MLDFGVVFVGWGCCICLFKYVNVRDMARENKGQGAGKCMVFQSFCGKSSMEEETSTIIVA